MKPEMGLWSFLERHFQSPRTRARLYYQGKMVTEGSVDASSQYIVNFMTYLVGFFPFCKYLLMSQLFIFPKDESEGKWKHQPKTEQDRKWHGYAAKK